MDGSVQQLDGKMNTKIYLFWQSHSHHAHEFRRWIFAPEKNATFQPKSLKYGISLFRPRDSPCCRVPITMNKPPTMTVRAIHAV